MFGKAFTATALSLLVLGGTVALRAQSAADTPTNPFARDPQSAGQGKQTFEATCAVCHGSRGTGGRGPALNGGRFAHGDGDYDLFQTIHDGVRGTGMPSFARLPANEIWHIVSYIRSLDGADDASGAAQAPATGDAARGARLFASAGCASCHEINGRGADLASDLSEEGRRGLAAIRAGLLHVPAPRGRGAHWVRAVTQSGAVVRGLVRAEDSLTLLVERSDGSLVRIDRRRARAVLDDPEPEMAMRRAGAASAADREDLAAYLLTLRQRSRPLQPRDPALLRPARLLASAKEPQNWLTYWGGYDGRHFSNLTQINQANVATLQARWAAQLPGASPLQATPIVVDGVMYVAGSPGEVQALDAATGLQIWKFVRKQDVVNPYQINPANRGVAVLDGRVFVGTLDDLLIAIDARSGRELWEQRIADTMEGFEITGAPLALPGKVIVGVGGGEFGLRGFLDAYDPATGKRLWRFHTIPGPGEPGNETWTGDTWKIGGGGTWLTGSYDPELNLLYWAVGNPAPNFNPKVRLGDNLYTDSVIALDPETGALRWHYQFTPNDSHDWDAEAGLVLADRQIAGKPRKLLVQVNRNGFHYVLDRTNGRFLHAEPVVRQSWNGGFEANGRPIVRPESKATPQGTTAYPALGATNFQAPSFDPITGVHYFFFSDAAMAIASDDPKWERGKVYAAGRRLPPDRPVTPIQGIQAIDMTGRTLWRFPLSRYSGSAGVLATAGGVVMAASADGNLFALDARSGKPLWHFQTGAPISASPIAYAVDGRQYIAIAAGNSVYAFALPAQR